MNKSLWTPGAIALGLLSLALLALLAVGAAVPDYTQPLFMHTTYYFLMALVLCWSGVYLHAARQIRREAAIAWLKANWTGLVVALAVTVIAWVAVHPALRMLSDEANLVGTSKNLYTSQAPTFTISGKSYYDSYWDVDVAIDQRPTLFPFLVSLVHVVCGYSYKNAFTLNLMVLPLFVLVAYRLAKRLGGETFAIVAAIFVVVHPITLIAVRSGGFDFLTVFFALLVLKSLADYCAESSPTRLAFVWMNLCMLAEIRYESALFIAPVVGPLLLFRMVTWSALRPYAFFYALTPAYLAPRLWQAILRGNVPLQEPGATTFGAANFAHNTYEYFKPILAPFHSYPAHSGVVIALGIVGCAFWLRSNHRELVSLHFKSPDSRFAAFVIAWMVLQSLIVFTYVWGRAQNPSSARLVIPIDTFFAFAGAWGLTALLRRRSTLAPVMLAVALLALNLPAAAQHRTLNRLTQTRENATTWRFFESLHEKRILIVTDRPNHYTIMDYGAMNFEAAKHDPVIFEAFARRLFYDIYVVQQITLATRQPLPGYEIWPDRKLETMLEFQNDANVLVRISRLAH
jgi:hypothetical protein